MLTKLFFKAQKIIARLEEDKTPTSEHYFNLDKTIATLTSMLEWLEALPELTEAEKNFYTKDIYTILGKKAGNTIESLKNLLKIDLEELELKPLQAFLKEKIAQLELTKSNPIKSSRKVIDLELQLIKIKETLEKHNYTRYNLKSIVTQQYETFPWNKQEENPLLYPENKPELEQLKTQMKELNDKYFLIFSKIRSISTFLRNPIFSNKEIMIKRLGHRLLHVYFLANSENIETSDLQKTLSDFFKLLFSTNNPTLCFELFSYMHCIRTNQLLRNAHKQSLEENPERINPLFQWAYKLFYNHMHTNNMLHGFTRRYMHGLQNTVNVLMGAQHKEGLYMPDESVQHIANESLHFILNDHTVFVASEAELLSVSNIAESADEGEASANAGTDKRAKRERPQETATALATASASAAKPEDLESTYKRPRHSYSLRSTVKQEPEEGAAASHE